jgi:transcriptional regulator with XRE-family HTH domain
MSILEFRAARGWSLEQTAKAYLVTAATISSWLGRLDEHGLDALVQLRAPVDRFPDFVHYAVQRLKTLCPAMGKVKIAETLARAGLHLGATTVGRILKEGPQPAPPQAESVAAGKRRVVTAKYPNHLWHVDLTVQPTLLGLCCSWLPFALPQSWPFAWWLVLAEDHFSRRVMGFAVFRKQPTSERIRAMLGRTVAASGTTPRHLVCDRGRQFDCEDFRRWCRGNGIALGRCTTLMNQLLAAPGAPRRRPKARPNAQKADKRNPSRWFGHYAEHKVISHDGDRPGQAVYRAAHIGADTPLNRARID